MDNKNTNDKTACFIIIGNEILSGRTQDTNLAYLGKWLAEQGINCTHTRIIPDIQQTIIDTLLEVKDRFSYIFTSGGLGPTHDDITAESIALALERELLVNREALQMLYDYYGQDNVTDVRKKMARIPQGAGLIANPVSGAAGFFIENIFVLAGVPKIQRAMLDSIGHLLVGGDPIETKIIKVRTLESKIAEFLTKLQSDFPDITIGSYPVSIEEDYPLRIVFRGTESDKINKASEYLIQECHRNNIAFMV